jgi:hypothetical protein
MQTNIRSMSMFPDQAPSAAKPKISPEEHRHRTADRLKTIRLQMAIGHELDDRGITTPAAIGAALGMPPGEATKLLTRHQWREGDVSLLEAAVARLEVELPEPASNRTKLTSAAAGAEHSRTGPAEVVSESYVPHVPCT